MAQPTGTVHKDMDDPAYFALDSIDQSQLKRFLVSPADWGAERLNPPAPSPAMLFGTAFHAHILGNRTVVGMPKGVTKASKAGKEFIYAHADDIIVSHDQMELLDRMKASMARYPDFRKVIDTGLVEQAIEWPDPATGIMLKAKVDLVPANATYIVDIKTTGELDDFDRSMTDYGYFIQSEFYKAAVESVDPALLNRVTRTVDRMEFWAFEKQGAGDWVRYTPDEELCEFGRRAIRRGLDAMARMRDRCLKATGSSAWDDVARYAVEHGGRDKDLHPVSVTEWQRRRIGAMYGIDTTGTDLFARSGD